jgi:hypothetical protein
VKEGKYGRGILYSYENKTMKPVKVVKKEGWIKEKDGGVNLRYMINM